MRLISLNIWGGKAFEPLIKFIKKQAKNTDIFCFQEVFSSPKNIDSRGIKTNILTDLRKVLPDFNWHFAPEGSGFDNEGVVEFDIEEGQAVFTKKKTIPQIDSYGSVFVRGRKRKLLKGEILNKDMSANFQYLRFRTFNKNFTICNLHGYAFPGSKLDTKERLIQSRKIIEFLNNESNAKILCGDFNLLPETKSLKMIEQEGMINLIKTFKIKRSRSRLSPYWGKKDFQAFADYMLVSPEIKVLNFKVPDIDVSDHLPLVLEFS